MVPHRGSSGGMRISINTKKCRCSSFLRSSRSHFRNHIEYPLNMPSANLKKTLHLSSDICVATKTPTSKSAGLLSDDDDQSEHSSLSNTSGGVVLRASATGTSDSAFTGFKINEEYARRFEYNQKRADKHRCRWAQTSTQLFHAKL